MVVAGFGFGVPLRVLYQIQNSVYVLFWLESGVGVQYSSILRRNPREQR